MCGIVGAIAHRNVASILLSGLKQLEYRGYDSAGIAVIDEHHKIHVLRAKGKVSELATMLHHYPLPGGVGIAHTRWATHGKPSINNAHPVISTQAIAVVHNGIIENYQAIRDKLVRQDYPFSTETDTEAVAHLIHYYYQQKPHLLTAVQLAVKALTGTFALGVISSNDPDRLIAVRQGSPLVIGLGIEENFIASDEIALTAVAQRFIYLEEGDIAEIHRDRTTIYDTTGKCVTRDTLPSTHTADSVDKGRFRHYMQKEIFQQANVIETSLEGRVQKNTLIEAAFGEGLSNVLDQVKAVQIVACGTSYHAGLVTKYWLEELVGIPCQCDIASEIRYRRPVILPGTLLITVSQSGETADTLAALKQAKAQSYLASLAICNVAQSTLVRECDFTILTRAGVEIGVASTKAFTSQLLALLLLTLLLARRYGLSPQQEATWVSEIQTLPALAKQALALDPLIADLAQQFADKQHVLFLGRGVQYPIALEGALKLKEISYIHAEGYPAGELKHGPLALVDKNMPVVTVAPNDQLIEKLKSNMQEVLARGGQLIVFADKATSLPSAENIRVVELPSVDRILAPIIYVIPLQLLAYHAAVLKGTDVDQPRNLAKSVTVE